MVNGGSCPRERNPEAIADPERAAGFGQRHLICGEGIPEIPLILFVVSGFQYHERSIADASARFVLWSCNRRVLQPDAASSECADAVCWEGDLAGIPVGSSEVLKRTFLQYRFTLPLFSIYLLDLKRAQGSAAR